MEPQFPKMKKMKENRKWDSGIREIWQFVGFFGVWEIGHQNDQKCSETQGFIRVFIISGLIFGTQTRSNFPPRRPGSAIFHFLWQRLIFSYFSSFSFILFHFISFYSILFHFIPFL